MRKLIVFFLLIAALSSNAQSIKATSDAYKGYINNINDNGSNTLTINDHSFLMVTTKFGKPDATLTLLDTKYNTIWQTQEMENYIAAALFESNILVISMQQVWVNRSVYLFPERMNNKLVTNHQLSLPCNISSSCCAGGQK